MDHRHRNAAADRRINEAVRRPQPAAIRVQEFADCVLRRLNVPELRRWGRTVQADMAPRMGPHLMPFCLHPQHQILVPRQPLPH